MKRKQSRYLTQNPASMLAD